MGPLEKNTRDLIESYAFPDATTEKVLAETAVSMAIVTDRAVKNGQAHQASTSALQLRQSINDLREILREKDEATDSLGAFLVEMKKAV